MNEAGMYCTSCEENIANGDHYQSPKHILNAQRKLKGLGPIRDIKDSSKDKEITKDDFIEHLEFKEEDVYKRCLFCDSSDTVMHYFNDHCLSIEEISYIKSLICPDCKEGFVSKEALKMHLDSGKHRMCCFDGTNLFCVSGRILNKHPMKYSYSNPIKKKKKYSNTSITSKITRKINYRYFS